MRGKTPVAEFLLTREEHVKETETTRVHEPQPYIAGATHTHSPEAFVQVVPLLSEGCLRRALLPPASAQSTSLARIRIGSPSTFAL